MSTWEPEGGWAVPPDPPQAAPSVPPAGPFAAPNTPPQHADQPYQPYQPYEPYQPPPEHQPLPGYPPSPPTGPLGPPAGGGPVPAGLTGRAHMVGTVSMVLALLLTAAAFVQFNAAIAAGDRASVVAELRLINSLDDSLRQRIDDVDAKVAGAELLSSLSWIGCGVLWILWQRRYVRNASRFGPVSPSLGWGTFGWIAPIAGYYLPQAQLANAARRTDPHQLLGKSGMAPPVLFVWWGLYGAAHLSLFAANLSASDALGTVLTNSFSIGTYHDAIDKVERSDQLLALSHWIGVGAALAAAATALVCTDRQRKLLGALGVQS